MLESIFTTATTRLCRNSDKKASLDQYHHTPPVTVGCPVSTEFDVLLTTPLAGVVIDGFPPTTLPTGTIICATQLGNHEVTIVLAGPPITTVTVTLDLAQPDQPTCSDGFVKAVLTSAITSVPPPITTSVCVKQT